MTMRKETMTRLRRCAGWALAAVVLMTAGTVSANDRWSSSGGNYYHGGHNHGGGHYTPPPKTTTTSSRSSGRRYHYSTGYRGTGSGFSFMSFNRGTNSNNGYTGPNTSINTPHRGDWNAKLQAQRRWDEAQFKKTQEARGAECGFTTSPEYCYRLQAPYPSELRIVRY